MLHPGSKDPALAGKWNDSRFNPPGLAVQDKQNYDKNTDQWTSKSGGPGIATAGQVVTYGPENAASDGAHATISLGHGWLINASDEPMYGQQGVNIKPDGVAGEVYVHRTVRTPQ